MQYITFFCDRAVLFCMHMAQMHYTLLHGKLSPQQFRQSRFYAPQRFNLRVVMIYAWF